MKFVLLLVCIFLLAFDLLRAEVPQFGNPIVQSFSNEEIGSDAPNWVVVQGPDGTVYIGGNCLINFDGERWRKYSINNAPALRGLDFATDGKLWAAALGEIGWFERGNQEQWNFHSLKKELPVKDAILGEVWHAFAEGAGALFVSTDKIIRWDGKKMKIWSFPGERRIPAMRADGKIYFHHFSTGLYVMDPAGPKLLIGADKLGSSKVIWVERNSNGLLLATSNGIFIYSNGKLAPAAPAATEFVKKNLLTSAVRLPDGKLVLGTFQGGIAIIGVDGGLEKILSENNDLPSNGIYSLFLDRANDLWGTSSSSVFRISTNSRSTIFGRSSGLPPQPICDIARMNETLYVATDQKVFDFSTSEDRFLPFGSLPNHIGKWLRTEDGLLSAGLGSIYKLANGGATKIYTTQQDVSVMLNSNINLAGVTFVSEGRYITKLTGNGSFHRLVNDLPDFATSLAEDQRGILWMGTPAYGVFFAKTSSNSTVNAVHASGQYGLPAGNGPSRVVASPDGTVLAFTATNGFILKPGAAQFAPIHGYPPRGVNAASEVLPDNTLWVIHPAVENRAATAARIAIKNGAAMWQPHSVDGLWGIGIPKCILAENQPDGSVVLWIGGSNGVLRNEVKAGPIAPAPRPPLLRALARVSDAAEPQPITQPLDYSTRGIVFEFAAPEFARRPALHLETQLEGVDEGWVPADATGRRELTALREGKYTFRVRAVAETGVASREAVSHFEIKPPWWRTASAMVAALLGLGPAGYAVYILRLRSLRRRNTDLEAKVRERTAQLAQASAAKTQFIASMSHDIRNPLNGIVGLALALEDTRLSPKQSELVATLRECTSFLSTLVDDVLDFASIEAGRVELRPGPFSPEELLQSIATMLKTEAIASGAALLVEADPDLPSTYVGDAGRIQQILLNYVSNALKYSGGRIRLTASIPADAREEIEFAVADEGPGISDQDQNVLFTKFTRLTDAQSKEITGTGLGLASCRLLAGLMGGSVGVQSSRGQGARFFLRLPLEVAPTPAHATVSAPALTSVPTLPNCSVLLVEDTNYNALAAAAVLAKFGLKCERVSSGAEALLAFAERRHNLVLLDRNLPDMDGTEVARRIREIEEDGPRAIVLAVTAYCTVEDRALCLNAGMDAFVGKPLTPEKLRRVLIGAGRRHLAAASMHVSPAAAPADVDVSLLEYISDGTDQGLSRQVDLFLTALAEAEKLLGRAAESADFSALEKAAHVVLSHARLVGSSVLANSAADLELAARNHDGSAFGDRLQRVNREIGVLTTTVRRYPGGPRTK